MAAGINDTKGLTVRNIGFLLERLAQDCDPLQYLRELTQNAIEAIDKTPEKTGTITWGFDEAIFNKTGVKKLCITDNGIGMTGEEMVEYINRLASSSARQGMQANFGIGAKITAGVNNPHGMVFISWKDGKGYKTHFWRDPKTKEYGLKPLLRADGTYDYWDTVPEAQKPAGIDTHGTRVILLGKSDTQDTTLTPSNAKGGNKWVRYYLNTRYATLPENITIQVDEGWKNDNRPFPVVGHIAYLDRHNIGHGEVQLDGAKAHWWILDEKSGVANDVESRGHVAALYQNELYEMRSGNSSRLMLNNFGVIAGTHRIVIYVEPTADETVCNSARRNLIYQNAPLPWARWAKEFENQMPDEISAFVESLLTKDVDLDFERDIRELFKRYRDLYDLTSFRHSDSGARVRMDFNGPVGKNGSLTGSAARDQNGNGGSKAKDGDAGQAKTHGADSVQGAFEDATSDQQGQKSIELPIPKIRWVKDNLADNLVDRAAECPRPSVIIINERFRGFQDLMNRFKGQWGHVSGGMPIIEQTVKHYYAFTIVEAVLGITIANKTSPRPIELTEDALTAAALARMNLSEQISRALRKKFGKSRDLNGKASGAEHRANMH